MTATLDPPVLGHPTAPVPGKKPDSDGYRPTWEQVALWVFVLGPAVAVAVGVWQAAVHGVGPTWTDAALAVVFYALAGHGVTVGFHRLFTHRSFVANRPLKVALAVAGSMSVEGPVIRWVADHRKHHAHSDRDGDPHSPWRFGTGPRALTKGLWWAHTGWLFDREQTSKEKYARDLLRDPDLVAVHKAFPLWVVLSLGAPALLGGLLSGSWHGAWSAFFWAGLVRVFVLHHVTWSINSVCHAVGTRPFESKDQARNVWPLAVLSMGESWHNLHHADPTCARHGVDPGQLDSSAALIRGAERLGWATEVRWPQADRLAARRRTA